MDTKIKNFWCECGCSVVFSCTHEEYVNWEKTDEGARIAPNCLKKAPIPAPAEKIDDFRMEFEKRFPTLSYDFICVMNEIGEYGLKKYAEQSLAYKMKEGDFSRTPRTTRREIAKHATVHFEEYIDGILHDAFGTRRHQLGAAAFNPMMEFQLSQLDKE